MLFLTAIGALALLLSLSSSAGAEPALSVLAEKGLSSVEESETIAVQGLSGLLSGSEAQDSGKSQGLPHPQITLEFYGPLDVGHVGKIDSSLDSAGRMTYPIPADDIRTDGSFSSRIVVLPSVLSQPGAYRVTVTLTAGGASRAEATLWLGKVAAAQGQIDLAFVWPLHLGVHRDPDGVFFDDVLEKAVAGVADQAGQIGTLVALDKMFPEQPFTLCVEPILLTQLRDMADGYTKTGATGAREQVSADAAPAKNATAALAALAKLADSAKREVDIYPYATPSMESLAREGWRDGLEQLQTGKQVVQELLALAYTPPGAGSPDLDISTDSLGAYAQASFDHVLVNASVAADLEETAASGAVTARVRDKDNRRATLVFADEAMQSLMGSPWDTGLFYAGLAAELRSSGRVAIVLTPQPGASTPPLVYLQGVVQTLERLPWVKMVTLSELVRRHSPGSRPVLLKRASAGQPGYIAQALESSVAAAHSVVADLAQAAGAGWGPVEEARSLLLTAESSWWSGANTTPAVASVGLLYATRARDLAQAELAKLRVSDFRSGRVWGARGLVQLVIENGAACPMRVQVKLGARGLTLPQGDTLVVTAQPGRTLVDIEVTKAAGSADIEAVVTVGSSVVGHARQQVEFVTLLAYLPWGIGGVGVVAVAAATIFLVRRSRKHRGMHPSSRLRRRRA